MTDRRGAGLAVADVVGRIRSAAVTSKMVVVRTDDDVLVGQRSPVNQPDDVGAARDRLFKRVVVGLRRVGADGELFQLAD